MDVAALSTVMSMDRLHMEVSVAVASKVMDTMETTSAEMVEMLASAASPDLGQNIDILV